MSEFVALSYEMPVFHENRFKIWSMCMLPLTFWQQVAKGNQQNYKFVLMARTTRNYRSVD